MKTDFTDRYKNLVVWQNASELRKCVYDMTKKFPKAEYRRVSQMRDAARSVKQNIQEGRLRRSEREFLQALSIARGSLAELKGDIEDSFEDGLITADEFEATKNLICKTDFLFHKLINTISNDVNAKRKRAKT